jgi:hypothetical protein
MRVFRVIVVSLIACVTAAGAVFAADDPLEIHGGGRVGFTGNFKGGAETGPTGGDNELGTMPNYGTSNYFGLSISKKITSESGAWAKTSVYIDTWNSDIQSDLQTFQWRRRDFHVEFGGLDFLPKDTILWGGLRGYGTGGNSQQDHQFINFGGMGFGFQNLGGVFSLAYMHEKSTSLNDKGTQYEGLGLKVTHNVIASVSVPVVDVYGAFGFSKKAKSNNDTMVKDDPETLVGYDSDNNPVYSYTKTAATGATQKNYTAYYVGGIAHAPMNINLGAAFATNGYGREMWKDQRSDTILRGNFQSGDETDVDRYQLKVFSATAFTVTDLAPGFYTATSIRYDLGKGGSKSGFLTSNTGNVLRVSSRWGKSITKNIGVAGTIGYGRDWAKKDDSASGLTKDVRQVIQFTPSVEIGLNTGYNASPKLQFYTTYTHIDSKHKFSGGAYDGKTSAMDYGMLCTFGF